MASAVGVGVAIPPVASFSDVNLAFSTVAKALSTIKTATANAINVLGGTSGGTFSYAEPDTGATLKIALGYLNAYENATTTPQQVIFGTAFTHPPFVVVDA